MMKKENRTMLMKISRQYELRVMTEVQHRQQERGQKMLNLLIISYLLYSVSKVTERELLMQGRN